MTDNQISDPLVHQDDAPTNQATPAWAGLLFFFFNCISEPDFFFNSIIPIGLTIFIDWNVTDVKMKEKAAF